MLREDSLPPTCHLSCVTCHVSHVTCHMPHAACHIFFYKMGKLVGGGSVINWATPSSLKTILTNTFSCPLYQQTKH